MAMKPKANPKPKTDSNKRNYMTPVGGAKQPGYKTPGSTLERSGNKRSGAGYSVGSSAQKTQTTMDKIKHNLPVAQAPDRQYLKTGINPAAMKATSGNPKPTTAQLAAGKKASDTAKAKATAAARNKAAADKAAKLKAATTAKKPTTGVYKRNQG